MKDSKYQPKQHLVKRTCALLITVVLLCMTFSAAVFAAGAKTEIPASVFALANGSDYVIGEASPSALTSVGTLSIEGNTVHEGAKDSVPVYKIPSGQASLNYAFVPEVLSGEADGWHYIDDKSKKINGVPLESAIQSGALILQTSLDGVTWVDEVTLTDIFDEAAHTNGFYGMKDIQLQNGCYYKVLVAYKMERQLEDTKVLLVTRRHYEYKQIVEEYVFYAYCETDETSPDATPMKRLGSKINTGKDNGYSGDELIDKNDPHYGWDIGYFYVNGYTRETADSDQTPVFLKNVGDRVTLWFHLSEDIKQLRGNEKLTVSEDTNGYDRTLQIAQTNFERGTLIIQHTNAQGEPGEPVVYTDYLAANASTGANTKVQLFEEGDYTVSLNYEIKSVGGPLGAVAGYNNYKIMFAFSIRNGNCMVYPFDITTGAELADKVFTENGFKLDMANSKYLTIDVKRSILTAGTDGYLTEDVRYNRPARDGESYTGEGIYTFNVSNLYTGEHTTKTIYVGTDRFLRALSATGMSVAELNAQIQAGATVHEDGTVELIAAPIEIPPEEPKIEEPDETRPIEDDTPEATTPDAKPDGNNDVPANGAPANDVSANDVPANDVPINENNENAKPDLTPVIISAVVIVLLIGIAIFIRQKKHKTIADAGEGGDEE